MSQYEQCRIIDSPQSSEKENAQQYVEIGSNIFLGTKDGIKYTLLPTSDDKFKLCVAPSDTSSYLSSSDGSWSPSIHDDLNDNILPSQTNYKTIKLITVKKEATPCRGQGDESGNSIISTPDSTSRFKSPDDIGSDKSIHVLQENQTQLTESPQLTYTTLMPKQVNSLDSTTYVMPSTYFQFTPPIRATSSTKSTRCMKSWNRMQFASSSTNPYPECSPIPFQRGRGVHRQRRPRKVFYQLRGPVMHSTPTSVSSSSLSSSIHISSIDSSSNLSLNACNESQPSLEYPRVPNNTPTSLEDTVDKQKVLDIQWIPQIQSRIANYVEMDPRESHNEKERKRRLRIKNACQYMKSLLPCVCNKTDNATVFENAVHFIAFMRETVGTDHEMEFLEQTSLY